MWKTKPPLTTSAIRIYNTDTGGVLSKLHPWIGVEFTHLVANELVSCTHVIVLQPL